MPTPAEIRKIEVSLEKHNSQQVSEQDFTKENFWFDKNEVSKDREYSHHFDRVHMIKSLLFRANAKSTDEGNRLSIRNFATTLGEIAQKAQSEKATFFDVLF